MPKFIDSIQDSIEEANDSVDGLFGLTDSGSTSDIVRSSRLAHKVFWQDSDYLKRTQPLLGFQYYVRINYNGELKDYVNSILNVENFKDTPGYVKSVKMPSVSLDTSIMNEYNRRRINQSKVNFDPVDITFHDLSDGTTLKLWQMYYQYYFSEGNYNKSDFTKKSNVNVNNFQSGDFGYNVNNVGNNRQLFKNIEIFQVSAGKYTKITLHNPKVSSFSQDTLASDKSELIEVNFSFDYEWASYEFRFLNQNSNSPQNVSDDDDMEEFFGQSDFLEYAEFDPSYTPETPGDLSDLEEIVKTGEEVLDTVEDAKGLVKNVAGKAARLSALGNQLQMNILGTDEPVIPLPDVRDLTAKVSEVPTDWSDVKRFTRRRRAGTPFGD